MFNGARTTSGINEILLRGSGRVNPLLMLSLASFKSSSCCCLVPLWLLNLIGLSKSFICLVLLSGKRGQFVPLERTFSFLASLGGL